MAAVVQPLFEGPVDLIGDIHGEICLLDALLARLGYDGEGRHPRGRRLVFCGDLVDRGQDSPATVERVAGIVAAGNGQAVLGNHELNLVLGKPKEGNGWFFESDHDQARGHFLDCARVGGTRREAILDWLSQLPVVLERGDLRVVHACWDSAAVDLLRQQGSEKSLSTIDGEQQARLEQELRASGLLEQRAAELAQWGDRLYDRNAVVPMLSAVAAVDSARQSGHALKVITSGVERPTTAPFFASGKWRMNERVAWWHEYEDDAAVVMGHYWRWPGDESEAAARSRGPNLFDGVAHDAWLGPRRNVMCVDWCAGLRWRERAEGITRFTGLLGALRWPEGETVYER